MEIVRYFKWEHETEIVHEPEEWQAFCAIKCIWSMRQFLTDEEQAIVQNVISRKPIPVLQLTKLIDIEASMINRVVGLYHELSSKEPDKSVKYVVVSPTCKGKECSDMIVYLRDAEVKLREKWSIINAFLRMVIQLAEI